MRLGLGAIAVILLGACSSSDDGIGTDLGPGSDVKGDAVADAAGDVAAGDLATDAGPDAGSDGGGAGDSDGVDVADDVATLVDADADGGSDGDTSDPFDADTLSDSLGDADASAPDADATVDTGPEIPEPDVTPDFDNCSPPGGDRNIYDLQDPQCPDHITPAPIVAPGVSLTLSGVIVTATMGDTFFVQEPAGGPYSGIAVFNGSISTADLKRGDVVEIEGSYIEFFDTSQITLKKVKKTGSVGPLEPFEIAHPSHIATDGPLAEAFEGVLVRVSDLVTTHTRPDCPNEFGEFEVTGKLRIDDMGYHWTAHLGDTFASITGVGHYSFGNHKVEPRDDADVDVTKAGGSTAISKCIAGECIAPLTATVSRAVIVNEVMVDPYGEDAGQEWIELYNTTNSPIDVTGWTIRDCATQILPFAVGGVTIPPKGYFVLGAVANPVLNGEVPVDFAYGSGFYLPNTVGAVLIYDAQQKLVDQMRYSRFDPFKTVAPGASMGRNAPDSDGTLPASWVLSKKKWGPTENKGTPGAAN
jgi:hypothetical protein